MVSRNGRNIVQVALPIAVSGISGTDDVRFKAVSVEVTGLDGQPYPIVALPNGERSDWLVLQFDRLVLDKLANGVVTLRGRFEVSQHRLGQTTAVPLGATRMVPGIGRCSSAMIERPNLYQESLIKVLCESLEPISPRTGIRLSQPDVRKEWNQHLGDSAPFASGPRETFLSPLYRLQTFFQIASKRSDTSAGDWWIVPETALSNSNLAITPEATVAWALVNLEEPQVRLRDYVIQAVP